MGKQLSMIKIAGRVGDVVGMKNGFGTASEAFIRKHVAEIKNPQSDSQMLQRIKMLPAVLFRRQLESVIRRAFQGKKYGGQSMREFMKNAMTEPLENIPQMPKNSVLAIPGKYLVSKGSIAPFSAEVDDEGVTFGLKFGTLTFEDATDNVADLSAQLLSNNAQLQNGDQLTFIVCALVANYPTYFIFSFQIDTASTAKISEVLYGNIAIEKATDGKAFAYVANADCLGGALVISREGANTPQRSTTRFAVNETVLAQYFASSLKADIVASYKKSASTASQDWPYEDVPVEDYPQQSPSNPGGNGGGGNTETQVAVTLSASPSEGGTVSGGGNKTVGSSATVVATASAGYTFKRWTKNGSQVSTNSSYTFTVTEAVALVAVFEASSGDEPGEDRP